MRLICKECGYRFESNKIPEVCPYCGAKNSIVREKTVQDFLDEVSE